MNHSGSPGIRVSDVWGPIVSPGTTLLLSSDAEKTGADVAMTKVKEFDLVAGGVYTVVFELKAGDANIAQATIYKNGVVLGTTQSTTGTTYVEKSEDLGFGFGDSIELWAKKNTSTAYFVQNLRIRGTLSPGIGVEIPVP